MRRFAPAFLLLAACSTMSPERRINVRIVSDEADAVLAILERRSAGGEVSEAEWRRVLTSEGYVRLKKREHSMGRAFEDDAFREFVMSPELLTKGLTLQHARDRMMSANLAAAATRALRYLPPNATIHATIYPVIKPRENSFVFENNAIFKYLEDEPEARFLETVSHELHHIGYGTACGSDRAGGTSSPAEEALRKWLGAFGEGFAVLAAAGGLQGHPYAAAEPNVRDAWLSGIADDPGEFARLERFFTDILDETLKGDAVDARAFEFFGLLGPWYTVGWRMATTIEQELGREELVRAFCGVDALLSTYNTAADAHERRTGEQLPRWSDRVAAALAP